MIQNFHSRRAAGRGGPGGWGGGPEFGGRGGAGGFGDGGFGGRGGGGRGDWPRGRPGGRGRRMFEANELKLILLSLIAEAPRHGYELIRAIEERTGGGYAPSPGVVYPTLTLLADMGLAAEQPGEGSRRLFEITEAGTAHLAENKGVAEAANARLDALAQLANRSDSGPIRRAMENLKMALHHRLSKEGADNDTMLDVASLIDEAASKIERLK